MNIKTTFFIFAVAISLVGKISPLYAESDGTWACKLGTEEWKAVHGGATLNDGKLTLHSGDDRIDGIFIMMSKPAAVGSFALNDDAQASFADTTGKTHRSKTGSGTLAISKYAAPEGDVKGKVEGKFSGTFGGDSAKEYVLNDCTFSLPIKNL